MKSLENKSDYLLDVKSLKELNKNIFGFVKEYINSAFNGDYIEVAKYYGSMLGENIFSLRINSIGHGLYDSKESFREKKFFLLENGINKCRNLNGEDSFLSELSLNNISGIFYICCNIKKQ